jgi:hypothetical protein
MQPPNLGQQLPVTDHPVARWASLDRIVSAWGDRAAVLRQHPADRLDPESSTIDHVVAMLANELHERGDGRSSSAAKKADAVFKIAFARRSSRFSRSNSTSRRRSSLETPGKRPITARRPDEPGDRFDSAAGRALQPLYREV